MEKKILAGWCPECGKITVVPDCGEEATCGCGHALLHPIVCDGFKESAAAIELLEGIVDTAYGSDGGDEEDEMDYIRELFCDGVAEDGCDNCPLCGYWCPFGGCRETGEAHEVKRFVVVPEPFPLTADGRTWEEAKENLMDGFKQAVLEGFKDAVEGGIGFTVIPLADGVNAAKAVKGGMR